MSAGVPGISGMAAYAITGGAFKNTMPALHSEILT